MADVIAVTAADFQREVLDSSVPVLVDFWAAWCGPCRMMAPVVEEIAESAGDRAKVCKVDVDEDEELAISFGIDSIPALLVFKNGAEAGRLVGVRPREAVEKLLFEA